MACWQYGRRRAPQSIAGFRRKWPTLHYFARSLTCRAGMHEAGAGRRAAGAVRKGYRLRLRPRHNFYMLRRYCPPTRYSAFEICPSEQWRTASIITAKTLPLSITAWRSFASEASA